MTLLKSVERPADLRRFDRAGLDLLAAEIRQVLVGTVCRTGGHLGPNLGVVELTIALHRVFTSPVDPIVWDIGHQAYVHKLLTGRQDEFAWLRQASGLSGYPSRGESGHDVMENSHASTGLAYVDGLARAFELRGEQHRVPVVVIGDGALTGGMAWEALNNIGAARTRPMVIVVNDNGRSYAPTVGGLAEHFAKLRRHLGGGSIFTELGLDYLGPVDGHDVTELQDVLEQARDLARVRRRAVMVHCLTVKGKGYSYAESDEADCMHAIGVLDPKTGAAAARAATWTDVFGTEIARLAADRDDLVGITAAMLRPVGFAELAEAFPGRVVDVGMAEQHAVTMAAGLAIGGMHPVVAVYATFFNRAFDQALMDVALHRLPVTFVLDRAGVTGEDGPSHHGMWDLTLMNLIPGMRVAAPRDAATLRAELTEAVNDHSGPTALRFPKSAIGSDLSAVRRIEGMDVLAEGQHPDVLVVSVGAMAESCLRAADMLAEHRIGATVVDPRWVLPINPALAGLAAMHRLVVIVEDSNRAGGVGTAVTQFLRDHHLTTPVLGIGLPPRFQPAGKRKDLLAEAGLDAAGLASRIMSALAGDNVMALRRNRDAEVRVTA
ncbi:1-deoxy-D-xylulose-5-phosphate synthase [Kibdelosporangium banguiense]|uniref:1-deoxy-D-xylulose-5-phosphate synthase n=1 Tax=Kibdelosporangium banguiense TaxID=1365924 RepID=A0ABS4TPW0_9PSEU|nr:1-deoxy-D-xylulose-5-phosphate synthase [Kibdelosporangium banguiense]MBP2326440.1 1-deoxy-D-xylulose-5-phosphate synthase [Kibdelosporangium banguiense]